MFIPTHNTKTTGFFGSYGGQFVPENCKRSLNHIFEGFERFKDDPDFLSELHDLHRHYTGRPSPIFHCKNLSKYLGGAQIYIKREDLNHLGSHKINNTLGQILLAKRMGKSRTIAETGAGQHGVATAATSALMGLECSIFMGSKDIERQKLNVFRMEMMGANVVPVDQGQCTLKEAVDAALSEWLKNMENSFYVLGSAVGPHPYPTIVRYFQKIIGEEARAQLMEETGQLPAVAIACVGGGSNAIGLFAGFVDDIEVQLMGVEPGGKSLAYGQHAASITLGEPGVLHGFNSYMLKNELGEAAEVHSISAGLDYPSVGPEHALLKDIGRAQYFIANDQEALSAFYLLSKTEGIIPALESAHAVAHAIRIAPTMTKDQIILVNLSGRGDKDVQQISNGEV